MLRWRWEGGINFFSLARQAAQALTDDAQENNLMPSLLIDIWAVFTTKQVQRIFTRTLVNHLNLNRPWAELLKGKPIDDLWLAQQLRPYGIRPRTIWIAQDAVKGYLLEDFTDIFRRYISRSDLTPLLPDSPPPSP